MHIIEKPNADWANAIVKGFDCRIGATRVNKSGISKQIRPVRVIGKPVDVIKHTKGTADALFRWRRYPKFMRIALRLVAHLIALVRRIAGITDIAVIGRRIINAAIALVIRHEQADI